MRETTRRRGLLPLLFVVLLLCLPGIAGAEVLTLTRAEALTLGRAALLAGNAPLADAIALHLLEADPGDVEALLLLSASEEKLGHAGQAFDLAKRAWSEALAQDRPDGLLYDIARHAARAALSDDRYLAAGHWLRRSIRVAPDPAAARQSRTDLAQVQSNAPLTFNFSAEIGPTDNLNGGASTGLLTVDNWLIGTLGGWSLQHAGYVAQGQLGATYDLGIAADGQSRDSVGVTLYATLHELTAEEKERFPSLTASDLDVWTLMANYTHQMVIPGTNRIAALQFEAGQNWIGGTPFAPIVRASFTAGLPAPPGAQQQATFVYERQWQDSPSYLVNGVSVTWNGSMPIQTLDAVVSGSLEATSLQSQWVNTTYNLVEATATYMPNQQIGPVQTSVGLGATFFQYPQFSLGFANVTKGRIDRGLWAQITFALPDDSLDRTPLSGLSPTLTLQQQMTWSNISKYEASSLTAQFGLSKVF